MSSVRFHPEPRIAVLLAQAAAESAAYARSGLSYGVSFNQGHRVGWRDAIQWLVCTHRVQWEARVIEVWPRLLAAGVVRTPSDVDLAIDSARQALHDDEGGWRDPDADRDWPMLEPHVWRFLDLTDTELAAVA